MRLREEIRHKPVERFAQELVEACLVSRERRRDNARYYRQLYYQGSTDGNPAKNNKVFSHVDKLASYLFSPSDVRFQVSFDSDESEEWGEAADMASSYVNRAFSNRKCDLAFSQANELGLIDGSAFLKLVWGRNGYEPHVIPQRFMGVLREDCMEFDQQEAFVHSFYVTPDQFRRLLGDHRDSREIRNRVAASFSEGNTDDIADDSYFHEIVTGGIAPIASNNPTGSRSSVGIFGPPQPMLSPEVATKLVRVDDLWVLNDDANNGDGDWTTIRYVDPGIVVEGQYMHRNLGDVPGDHPFIKVGANEINGYFWGRSELASVAFQQEWMNARVNNIDDIFALRARPPRSFVGFSGLTPEKMRALLTRGGTLSDDSPTGQIQSHAPEMPAESLEYIKLIDAAFDEASGTGGMLGGEGASGVRSGNHAQTMLRTSSPRVRDRAMVVEKQASAFGDLCFQMSRAKDARIFTTPKKKEFVLEQLPSDAIVTVDSHSSSPAFSGDHIQLAFALNKAQAIDGEGLLELTAPPHVDRLIMRYRKAQEAKQQLIQQHPELLQKGGRGHK